MKKTVMKRYIKPTSEVFEMEGFCVLQAGSPLIVNPGNAGGGSSDSDGSGNKPTNEVELDPDSPDNEIWP